ncbi:hypothetical protein IGM_00278 [Bacillus cereus HuB4-4]|uniref:Nucleotidyltransferase n=1 Tax=Bacillus cereus HuB4-4 TaxID=1053211 RepID=A0A9W5VP56_BACCE|nr:nucleotidyltransferase domain-containing protein [Bacillus cereus]EOP99242.1 hypothetical protein IGM_00278 [Bacillus cereus HuB4-4]
MERNLLFSAVVGSHNYGLNDENSDVDRKEFYIPTFHDLVHKTNFEKSITSNDVDVEIKDVRSLINLFSKSNASYIEVLFSEQVGTTVETGRFFKKLYALRHDIARMNLPRLLACCLGMALSSLKEADKINNSVADANLKTPGKSLMKAYRVLDLFIRFYIGGFEDFGGAVYYSESERSTLLDIKNNKTPYEDALEMIKQKEKIVLELRESIADFHNPGHFEETKKKIELIVEEVIREFLMH